MEVSKNIITERQKYIKSITQFIDEKREKLQKVLKELGLSGDELLKFEDKQVCPYNKDHILPAKSFNQHVERCRLLLAGYEKDELPVLLQDVDFCYKDKESIMKIEIDEKSLNKIIWDHCVQNGQVYTGHRTMPVSYIDESIMLTQEDRLAVYNHVVKKSHEAGKVIPVDRSDELLTTDWSSLVKKGLLDEQNNKQFSSKLEQLAALRDLKRRRQSYRAKNVHITKKSYTEIIREVISNQMEILVPGNSSDVIDSQNQEDFPESKNESRSYNKHESRERDRRKDYSPSEREKRGKDYERDDGKRRSKDRDRRISVERHRDRSEERHSNWREKDKMQWVDKGGDRKTSKRRYEDNSQSPNKDKARKFTEAENIVSGEILDKSLADDTSSNMKSTSADGTGSEIATEEMEIIDGSITNKSDISKKRSQSDSDGSSNKNSGKHKKSKHKKKRSKKHKRRD